jgi:hypothetical protein
VLSDLENLENAWNFHDLENAWKMPGIWLKIPATPGIWLKFTTTTNFARRED